MLDNLSENFHWMPEKHLPKIVAVYEDDFNFLSKMCLTRMRDMAWQMARAAVRSASSDGSTPARPSTAVRPAPNTHISEEGKAVPGQ